MIKRPEREISRRDTEENVDISGESLTAFLKLGASLGKSMDGLLNKAAEGAERISAMIYGASHI